MDNTTEKGIGPVGKMLLCMFVIVMSGVFYASYEQSKQNKIEKQEQDTRSIKYFSENKELIYKRIDNLISEKNDIKALILLEQYIPTYDEKIIKLRNETRERILLARLKLLPDEDKTLQENLRIREEIYSELNKLKPDNPEYQRRHISASNEKSSYEAKELMKIIVIL